MTPTFRILANKKDITERLEKDLLSLRIVDEAGLRSDLVEIRLDDRDGKINLTELTGAELEVFIGYKETGLARKGVYTVDDVGVEGPPSVLSIVAKAANMKGSLKIPKERSWDDVTFGSLVAAIAAEHGLEPGVSETLADVSFEHLDQTTESDMHFLTRLAIQHDAVAKPAGGQLLLMKAGEAKAVSGKSLTTLVLEKKNVVTWRMNLNERSEFPAVVARWHNKSSAQLVSEQAGEGSPVFTIRQTFPDAAQAKDAAVGKLEQLRRGRASISLTIVGKPEAVAEANLSLSGLRQGIDGEWLINRVVHTINESGYLCSIDAKTP